MKKSSNPSTRKKKAPKVRKRWQDEYLCFRSWRLQPIDKEYIDEKGREFVKYCFSLRSQESKAEHKVTYERFLEEHGIPYTTMESWKKKSKYLQGCIRFGFMCIGNYLEEGLLFKTLSEKATMYQLHLYLDRWDKTNLYQDERIKKVRDTEADKPTQVTVNMVDYSKKKDK